MAPRSAIGPGAASRLTSIQTAQKTAGLRTRAKAKASGSPAPAAPAVSRPTPRGRNMTPGVPRGRALGRSKQKPAAAPATTLLDRGRAKVAGPPKTTLLDRGRAKVSGTPDRGFDEKPTPYTGKPLTSPRARRARRVLEMARSRGRTPSK